MVEVVAEVVVVVGTVVVVVVEVAPGCSGGTGFMVALVCGSGAGVPLSSVPALCAEADCYNS